MLIGIVQSTREFAGFVAFHFQPLDIGQVR